MDDVRDEIVRLEGEIEALAAMLEGCRKIVLLAKIIMAAGATAVIALLLGLVTFNPLAMIVALTAVIGGIVAYGANISTARQAAHELKAAEALRAELIEGSDLRIVNANGAGSDGARRNGSSALTTQ